MDASNACRGRLRLADHVRACAIDGQVILLDLRRSKYIGIGGGQSQVLATGIEGWPGDHARPSSGATGVDRFAAPLLAQGLLTRAPPAASQGSDIEAATRSLNAEDANADSKLGWRRFARVLHASTATALQLRMRSLASIAHAVGRRRRRGKRFERSVSHETLQEAVAAYVRLRLYVFTAHDQCLHDSLTLLRFLAAESMFPSWVIGVRTRPFGAHSWLQSGQTVLNDQHERVRHYQPILVV